ncbi:Uma2 family endonuclease [Leptolyngbya sp. NK1-12]|uniref:Uma2 family endonuclease n=1 Tax=Leptolyngbya sp. NK1-12 TaxID=2547451 RepID=A0AA96WLX2_9CYAN|nr:Uma2 family endonuclease [Leptolyngbya sp. NK1-12]WNZ27619.1 Uma2 family endonuclease [Leptolyngbya sp. NK1-12]
MVQLLDKTHDQLITLPGTWEGFKLVQQGLQDSPGARLAFYDGVIEILMPGELHEVFAHIIGYLITTFLTEKGIPFVPTRQKDQEREGLAFVQADESYCLGRSKPIPDLSIEVVLTSGGISKLTRYQALGVPEVWFWQDGTFALYHLGADGYQRIEQSQLPGLETLDIELLRRCVLVAETDVAEAIRTFRKAITNG